MAVKELEEFHIWFEYSSREAFYGGCDQSRAVFQSYKKIPVKSLSIVECLK